MLNWSQIDNVLLDMDGTLLDLRFDTHFWQEHVPRRYAEHRNISLEAAKQDLYPLFRRVEGTLSWYCLDYWSEELGMDVAGLKQEVDHLIAVHPYVIAFLDRVRALNKRVSLVTNAHRKSLALKMERTRLEGHFDEIVCSHDLGSPKEDQAFWSGLQRLVPFDPRRTLLVDDSVPVLRAARRYGIAHLFGVHQPDTQAPPRDIAGFPVLRSFRDIIP